MSYDSVRLNSLISLRVLSALVVLIALTAPSISAQGQLADPHQILNQYFEASGGLDRLKAEKSSHSTGTLAVAGMEGKIEIWTQYPERTRADVTLGPLDIKQGTNDDYSWVLDQNGKLQKITKDDEITRQRREIARRMADYEHADPKSDFFTVTLDGREEVETEECYVISIANRLNDDKVTMYIDVDEFLLRKTIALAGENSSESYPSDYRSQDGLMIPFGTREVSLQTGQEQVITLSEYESNPKIAPDLFYPPGEGRKDYTFTDGDRSEDIPFQFTGGHIVMNVIVACHQGDWVLDSGAGMTVISKAFAERLGLDTEGEMKGSGAGGTVDISLTTMPSYSIRGIEFEPQTVAVIDLTEINRMFGIELHGILGYDFLSRFVTRVDYANEQLSFYDPDTYTYSGDGTALDVHLKGSVFEVEATLDGSITGTWLFDLGATRISLDGPNAVAFGYADREGIVGLGRGAGNTYQTKTIRCERVELAGFSIDNPKVGFRYDDPLETDRPRDRLGLLGNSLFRNFVVYLDYANERVVLERGEKFNQPWPEDRSGLQMQTAEDHLAEVIAVAPDTPADKAGFEVGDILRSINGIDIDHFDGLLAVRNILKGDVGTKLEFVVDRNGDSRKLRLTLRDLL